MPVWFKRIDRNYGNYSCTFSFRLGIKTDFDFRYCEFYFDFYYCYIYEQIKYHWIWYDIARFLSNAFNFWIVFLLQMAKQKGCLITFRECYRLE